MSPHYGYVFPAIRGVQAGREYYVSMCPIRLLPRIFLFDENELQPELRAQRTLNKARIPEMSRYITENPDSYTFSAITASIDGEVSFEPISAEGENRKIGTLTVPMSARFVINDGQHRRAAIQQALHNNPEIGDESIAVVFFLDSGLQRCQQMFADLNRHAVRPSKSIGVLYDQRDDRAQLIRLVVLKSPLFRDLVEMERSTLSVRSRKLFTLSALYSATNELLPALRDLDLQERAAFARSFWETVGKHLVEWQQVRGRLMHAGEVRRDLIHSHGIILQALGRAGCTLVQEHPDDWKDRLRRLRDIDWSRANGALWEGRAMIGGRVSKAQNNVILATNVIKQQLGLALSPDEQRVEDLYLRSQHGQYD